MTNKKISELVAKTTVHNDDMFALVDTEATPDETKKVTGANMKSQMTSTHAALTTGAHGVNGVDNFGAMTPATTFYVRTTGNDANDGLTEGNAFLTVQKAIDCIAGQFSGNIVIDIGEGTFAQAIVIGGKVPTGDYTITLRGVRTVLESLVVSSAVLASATNITTKVYGTVTRKVGTWTVNQRQNKWLRFTSGVCNGEYFLIDSSTETVATLTGRFNGGTPAEDDTFNVEEPATKINSFVLSPGQITVVLEDIDFIALAATNYCFPLACKAELHRCNLVVASVSSIWLQGSSYVEFDTCYSGLIRWLVRTASWLNVINSKIYRGGANRCAHLDSAGIVACIGTIYDGAEIAGSRGIYCLGLGMFIGNAVALRADVSATSNIVRNTITAGIEADLNGVGTSTIPANDSFVTFVNNTNNTVVANGGEIA